MPCACKQNKKQSAQMVGGYEALTIYVITKSTDPTEKVKTVTSNGPRFVVERDGTRQTFTQNNHFGLKESEIAQLLEQGAPIYVYG